MLYCSWDMVRDRCNYFSFWTIFCPFTHPTPPPASPPPNSLKNQKSKKMKKRLEISSFYTCVPKMMIRWCMVPEIWYATDGRMDRWTEKVTYRGWVSHLKRINILNRVQLSLWWKKTIIVNKILLYKLWYSKNNSSALHLEERIRYFRHRDSIKLSKTSMNLKIIKPHQCSLERSHAVLIELKE